MKAIRTAIVGYGLSGAVFHAPFIDNSEHYALAAICSSRSEEIHKQYPGVNVVNSPAQLFADNNLDLIIIASPTATHYEYARDALLSGKHVVVEKPFTITSAEGEQLAALASQSGKILGVYQNRRYDNDFIALTNCISNGSLGTIYSAEFRFDRFRPQAGQRWKEQNIPGAGCLYDIAPHMIDHCLALFGMPDSVYAELACQRPGVVITDWMHILLNYSINAKTVLNDNDNGNREPTIGNNLRVTLNFSNFALYSGPRMLVYGDKGTFIKHGMDPQERLQPILNKGVQRENLQQILSCMDNSIVLYTENNGIADKQPLEPPIGDYSLFYSELYHSIANGTPPPVSAAEGTAVIRIIELALQSAAEGRKISTGGNNRSKM